MYPPSFTSNALTITDKKKWLKPGESHIIGRTKKLEKGDPKSFITIKDGKVSRKHLKIIVAPVKSGNGVGIQYWNTRGMR